MAKAIWEGAIIAESDTTVKVEGNRYFPPGAVNTELLLPSEKTTICGWKGEASYYNVVVDGKTNRDAGWYYPAPKNAASEIKDHVAFWRGVEIRE
jgi:uncharacterized protein (DUF427 family)